MNYLIRYRVKGSNDDWSYYEDSSPTRCTDYVQMCEFAEDIEYELYSPREEDTVYGMETMATDGMLMQDLIEFGTECVPIKLKSLCNSGNLIKHCDSWSRYGAFRGTYHGAYIVIEMKSTNLSVFFITEKYLKPENDISRNFIMDEDLDVYVVYMSTENNMSNRKALFINSEYCCSMHEHPDTEKIREKII